MALNDVYDNQELLNHLLEILVQYSLFHLELIFF